jgi:hypothetical protein
VLASCVAPEIADGGAFEFLCLKESACRLQMLLALEKAPTSSERTEKDLVGAQVEWREFEPFRHIIKNIVRLSRTPDAGQSPNH